MDIMLKNEQYEDYVCPIFWEGNPIVLKVFTHYKTPKWQDGDGHTGQKWVKAKLEMCDKAATIALWKHHKKETFLKAIK